MRRGSLREREERCGSTGWRSSDCLVRRPARGEGRRIGCDYGTNSFNRTCHLVLWPGLSVTMSVSILPHSSPNGSAKLYWCSMATKLLLGGAYIWMVLISGDTPWMLTP